MSANQVPGGARAPGTQNHMKNAAAAAMDLTMLAADEFIALGTAMKAQDPLAITISQEKLGQIQAAGAALGLQGQAAPPQPQGGQSGVPTPAARPIDPITRRGV